MITRPLVFVILCFGFFILLQSLVPKVMALKRPSKMNEFMLEDQRTRKRKNYVVKMDRNSEILGNTDTNYDNEPLPSDHEELSAFIVDYANMIRNDVILLDNSVETRTRKRGNIKVKKLNQAIPDPPCSCTYSSDTKDFGENSVPRYVETRNCSSSQENNCVMPYVCKENLYELTIIRRREPWEREQKQDDGEHPELPNDLKYRWLAEKHLISVGCVCQREYIVVT